MTLKLMKLVRFSRNAEGSVAVVFALAAVVLVAVIGGAVDFRNVYNAQTKFQSAADSAALAAAIHYRTAKWSEARKAGKEQFNKNVELSNDLKLTKLKIKRQGEAIVVTAKGKSKNYLLSIVGMNKLKFAVKAVVKYPEYPVEVSLVLDNTFSMSVGGKIQALKAASNSFIDTLLANPDDDVKISIVPFAQYVNVGVDKIDEPWLDAKNEVITVPEQCSMSKDIIGKSGCSDVITDHPAVNVPETCTGAVYNDGVLVSPAQCTPAHTQAAYTSSAEQCDSYTYGPEYETCQPEYTYTIYWNGCVASRNYPLNLKDDSFSTKVPGPNNLSCGSQITPLSDDKDKLHTAVNAMTTVGDTYIPQGIVWGTRTLSDQKPFDQAMPDAERVSKKGKRYLLVMTDGINVRSPEIPTSPLHNGSDVAKANGWLLEACTNAKAKDIIVYAVTFGASVDEDTKTLMRSCASSPELFFDAATNDNLQASFDAIAASIRTVFLSQ